MIGMVFSTKYELDDICQPFLPLSIKKKGYVPVLLIEDKFKSLEIDVSKTEFKNLIFFNKNDLSNLEGIIIIIPYNEESVEVAEELSHLLNLRSNNFRSSSSRRDKFEMLKRLSENGLRCIETKCCKSKQDILDFTQSLKIPKYIIKPLKSSGSDDVYICKNYEDLEHNFSKIIGKFSKTENFNDSVLVQKYIEGIEYVLNFVSRDGVHKLISIYKVIKNNQLFNTDELMKLSDVPHNLIDYALKVLDALEISNGASRSEIKVDEKGPVLIETAARVAGDDYGNIVSIQLTGYDHFEAMLDSLISQESFDRIPKFCDVKENVTGVLVTVNSYFEGVEWKTEYFEKLLNNLKTCVGYYVTKSEGQLLVKTTDLFNYIGIMYLIGAKEETEEDIIKIKDWEKTAYLV